MRTLLLLLFASTWPVVACSCVNYGKVQACEIYQSTPVIFRGRVVDDNDDRTRGFAQMTLYRFKVLEAFKGIPPGTNEVFIDPASMTSCYNQFEYGRDYLVYTGGGGQTPVAVTILGRNAANSKVKPIPEAWKRLGQLPVYVVGECNPTRTVEDGDADLTYLRNAGKINPHSSGWIEGQAVQNFMAFWRFDEFVAAADATFQIAGPSGERNSADVRQDGTFTIGPLPPGRYAISARSRSLGNGDLRTSEVEVPPGGCAVARATFPTHASISGSVVSARGRPARDVRVELGELQPGGILRVIPGTWSDTDESGRFKTANVPIGRIVLAANLNGAPTTTMPFDSFFAPGTQDVSKARVFTVQPGQEVTGVTLRLPRPLLFGGLYVRVYWPDGSPALDGARAFADWNGAQAGFERAEAGNEVKLRLALNRKYQIRVDWLNGKPGKFLFVEGGAPSTVDFTTDRQRVELRLKSARPF
jgi:hypothetical protein